MAEVNKTVLEITEIQEDIEVERWCRQVWVLVERWYPHGIEI